MKMAKEKDEIMAMKVSQLGLQPGESPTEDIGGGGEDRYNHIRGGDCAPS